MSKFFNYVLYFIFFIFFVVDLNAQAPTTSYDNTTRRLANNVTLYREACVGDSITVTYNDFYSHPSIIQLEGDVGRFDIPLTAGHITTSSNGIGTSSGTIGIRIPGNARTGYVTYVIPALSAPYSSFNDLLIIHKENLTLYLPPAPFCATDTIALIGYPETIGAIFSSTPSYPNFISGDSLIGINAGWSPNTNDSIKDISITYAYLPEYIDGTSCPDSISISRPVQIRDNRLDAFEFQELVTNGPTADSSDRVNLDSLVQNISPSFFQNYPVSFTGDYINQINGVDSFFTGDAGQGAHSIMMQYNNGGCIGELIGELDVLPPLRLSGVLDTLCNDADSIIIRRDTSYRYAYSIDIDTILTPLLPIAKTIIIKEFNIIDSVYTQDSTHHSAVVQVSPLSHDEYIFYPNAAVLDTVLSTTIVLQYTALKTTTQYLDANDSIVNEMVDSSSSVLSYPIILLGRPTVNLSLDSTYCKNSTAANFLCTPAFEPQSSSFRYTFSYAPSGPFSLLPAYLSGNQFNPDSIYTQSVPLGFRNQDLYIKMIYDFDKYGCVDSDTQSTKINKPIADDLRLNPSPALAGYCQNSIPIELIPENTITNPLGTGLFLVDSMPYSPLIDSTDHFLPSVALSGDYNITYQFTDISGCVSTSFLKVISIRESANVQLHINGDSINPEVCANLEDVLLELDVISGSSATSIAYSSLGLTIVDDTLKPQQSYVLNNNANVTQIITVNYRDSFSCSSFDDIRVSVYKPSPTMNGFLGTFNNNVYRYCNNENAFPIIESPNHVTTIDTIIGAGVMLDTNGVYFYNPNLILVDSFTIDTVRYEYEDNLGCSSVVRTIVQIDSIPEVSLNGLAASYCLNDTLALISGLPSAISPNSSSRYSGPGTIHPQQNLFSPSIAGIGIKEITYSFEDDNGCENSISDTTIVHSIPILQPNFTQSQYCSYDPIVILDTSGNYVYWGNIIDSTNILNPQNATGQQTVFYTVTDSVGCTNTDSTIILINPFPGITISGLDSAYCFNNVVDDIFIAPLPSLANASIAGSSAGFSISSTGVTFAPNADSIGSKLFRYTYTDSITNCFASILLNTRVYDVPTLNYTGIKPVYCATDQLDSIAGIPSGGVFSGQGTSSDTTGQYSFNPFFSIIGSTNLNYKIIDSILYNSSDTLFCPVDIDIPIVVNALPSLQFDGPGDNYRFCSNEADVLLGGSESFSIFREFTSDSLGAVDSMHFRNWSTFTIDTLYYFSPSNAGAGLHDITYTGTDSITGCQNTIIRSYDVTDYGDGASFLLDSAYCASSDSILLSGSPAGGGFLRNQDTIPSFYLTLNTSTYLLDTIIYKVIYEACSAADTQFVEIHPLINVSFVGSKPSKTYCFGDDDVLLVPNILGGTFSGNTVITGDSIFNIEYATAGDNIINYTFIDTATSCASIATDTFSVYGMPILDYQVLGGCQGDSIFFYPDNNILGLDNRFGGQVIDSITDIIWELEPGALINGTMSNSNSNNTIKIDSISHIFSTPGIYQTKLYVANRTYCIDSTTVQVIVSPTTIVTDGFPYDEPFETDNGYWYAEAKDSSHNELWEWGTDTIPLGINDPSNKIWVTNLNDQYEADEAAWVYSPCFDISSLERPMIRLDHWSDTRNRGDGAVLEYQDTDGTWSPVGEVDRGINWFNTDFIAGAPGNQTLSPIGWSGQRNDWVNSRYKLDEFKNTQPSKLRLRMAFGSSSINLGTFYNGFAFDNVWIGNRTRNVLLETTSNIYEPDMDNVNNYVYQLAYHSPINKDVILLQYHSEAPNDADEFHQYNRAISNARTLFYGIFDAGTAFIDGISNTRSKWLDDLSFEQNMLESPKFEVEIDTFYHTNPGQFTLTTTITALVDITAMERYRINMVITEDSLSYTNGENVHAVVRKDYPSNSTNTFDRTWAAGDQVTLTHVYSSTGLNYVPNHFQAVVFIQAQLDSAREVFQAATTRDVNGYWVGVDQVASEQDLNEIKDMTLYPNPAKDYINIDFPELLEKDYNWKLISIGGITVKEDVIHAGEQSLTINNYDLPSGVYIFMVYNGNVYSQRKVIINQN